MYGPQWEPSVSACMAAVHGPIILVDDEWITIRLHTTAPTGDRIMGPCTVAILADNYGSRWGPYILLDNRCITHPDPHGPHCGPYYGTMYSSHTSGRSRLPLGTVNIGGSPVRLTQRDSHWGPYYGTVYSSHNAGRRRLPLLVRTAPTRSR
jgi:hypothetical protein